MASGVDANQRKRLRRGEVEERLRGAIRDLAAESNYRDLRVEELAARAGLSRSAFYFYYPGKLELLLDATQGASEELFGYADLWYSGDGDSKVMIIEVLRNMSIGFARHADLLRMAAEVAAFDEDIASFWRGLVDRFTTGVSGRLQRDQQAGLARPEIDAASSAEILVFATETYLLRNVGRQGWDPEHAVEAMAPVWLRALYPD